MNLSDAINKIKERDYAFEISVEGKAPFGKERVSSAEAKSGTLYDYFSRIAKFNNTRSLGIQLYTPNGTSWIRKDFFLVDIPAVVESTKIVDPSTTDQQQQNTPIKHATSMVTKSDIEAATLKVENTFLKERTAEYAERIKKLEQRQDELIHENNKLSRENVTVKDKTELEWQQKLNAEQAKNKQGLSGIFDEIKDNPETLKFIAGFFPNHGMNKALSEKSENNPVNGAETKHTDPDAQACIEMMMPLLHQKSGEQVGMICMIVEDLCLHDTHLINLYKHLTAKKEPEKTQ